MPKLIRRITLLAVGLLVLAGLPAQAAPYQSRFCHWYWDGDKLIIDCVDAEVMKPFDWDDCPPCGAGLQWRDDHVINPATWRQFGLETMTGLQTLGRAEFTRDPAQRAKLEALALDQFTAAARIAGKATIAAGPTAVADPLKNVVIGADLPWADAAATDIADGITLLQRSFADPGSAPRLRTMAAGQFAEAYDELAQQQVIGS